MIHWLLVRRMSPSGREDIVSWLLTPCLLLSFSSFVSFFFLEENNVRLVTLKRSDDIGGGIVQVYHNGEWGTICDKNWSLRAAQVVCNELGYKTAIVANNKSFFAEATGPVSMNDLYFPFSTTLSSIQYAPYETKPNCNSFVLGFRVILGFCFQYIKGGITLLSG